MTAFLLLTGALMAALNQEVDGDRSLLAMYAPVVGPWVAMGVDAENGDLSVGGAWGLGALGVLQAVGLGLSLHGGLAKRTVLQKQGFGLTHAGLKPLHGQGAAAGVSGRW